MKINIFVLLVLLTTLACAGCGTFDSGLESEFRALKAEKAEKNCDSACAKALLDKASAFVERVQHFDNPPKDLPREARLFQLQRAAEWVKISGTEEAKNALQAIKDLVKNPPKLPNPANPTATDAKDATEPALTPDELAKYKKNADPRANTIPSSGKPERK